MQTFQRIEIKYLVTKNIYDTLLLKLKGKIKPDLYFKSTICNVYYDTVNSDLIIHSLDKPLYKEKVRLRSYNIPKLDDTVFLEIKKKFDDIVVKRRISLKLKDFYNNKIPNTQIKNEIDYLFKFYDLRPTLYLAYDRLAYIGVDDSSLRITFDKNIRSRMENLCLEKGDYGEKLFDDNNYLMEIKASNALPLWLVQMLSELQIYPTSFSKYGKIYEKKRRNYV